MALKDFKEYVASKGGGGAEQYVDPSTGKIKVEKTGGAVNKTPAAPAASTTEKTSWLGNAIQQTNNAYSNTADYYKKKAEEKTGGTIDVPTLVATGNAEKENWIDNAVTQKNNALTNTADYYKDKANEKAGVTTPSTTPAADTNNSFDFGAANNLGTALKPVNTINPALSITANNGNSAWSQAKDAVSQNVATATGKDYVPHIEQVQNKVNNPVTPTPTVTTPPINVAPTPTPTPTVTTPTINTAPTVTPTPAPSVTTPPTNVVGGQAGSGNAPTPITWEAPTLSGATDMSDYINEMYSRQREAQLAALESGYNQQMAAIDAAASNIPQQYYEAGRQQAGQNALDTKAMNERLVASGLNTGSAGQAALAQSAVNQGNMAKIRQAEADAKAEVEQKRASTAIAYQDAIKEAMLNNDTQKAIALYQEAQRVDESMVNTALKQAELDRMEYEYQQEAQMQAQERADKKAKEDLAALEKRAATMASIGDFSLYQYLGYSPEQITALGNAYIAANTPKSSGGGGGGGGGTTLTFSKAKELADNHYIDANVAAALMAGGYSADILKAMYGYDVNAAATPSGGNTPQLSSARATEIWDAYQSGQKTAQQVGYLIQSALNNGRITQAEAEAMMAATGY